MGTLRERIGELMTAMKWDVPRLATVAGVSQSAVWQWLGKGSKEIGRIGDIEVALSIERESGFSALWLAKGKGPKMAARATGGDAMATLRRLRGLVDAIPEGDRASVADLMRAYLAESEASERKALAICALLEDGGAPEKGSWKRRAA